MKSEIKIVLDHMTADEIWRNLDSIMASGVDIDYLISLGEPKPGYFAKHYCELLDLGADPRKLFEANEQWHLLRSDWFEELKDIFQDYIDYGLEENVVEEWLRRNVFIERFIKKPAPFKNATSIPPSK